MGCCSTACGRIQAPLPRHHAHHQFVALEQIADVGAARAHRRVPHAARQLSVLDAVGAQAVRDGARPQQQVDGGRGRRRGQAAVRAHGPLGRLGWVWVWWWFGLREACCVTCSPSVAQPPGTTRPQRRASHLAGAHQLLEAGDKLARPLWWRRGACVCVRRVVHVSSRGSSDSAHSVRREACLKLQQRQCSGCACQNSPLCGCARTGCSSSGTSTMTTSAGSAASAAQGQLPAC
jgi:hypothetical protein